MSSRKQYKAAIIGLGPHGKRLVSVLSRIPEIQLSGVVDRDQKVLEGISELNAGSKFTSTADLYATVPGIDLVLVATNGPSHASLANEAMQQGAKYVLVEKPMACSVEECNSMLDMARQNSARLAVNKKNRHDQVFRFIKEKLDSGEWGELRSVYMQVPGIGLGCLGTHWFDMANFLFGKAPQNVTAWVDEPIKKNPRGEQFRDPGGLVVMNYGPNQRAVHAQVEDGAGPMTVEIHSTAARIFFDPKNKILDIRARDMSVIPGPGRPAVYNKVEAPAEIPLNGDMIDQMESVLRELISDQPMLTDGSYGKDAVEILVAAYVSQEKGNIPVSLPLNDPEQIKKFLPVT